ncbi:hypothetical protein CIW48_21565 [Methylobacterium sp. P1-11]|nr:hypothetical protein CIW48_21565 [Methylobacterium sp. P1-11]
MARGRTEFGHSALGARSILADPREAAMRDRIKASVKFREEFRPLASSILHEHDPDHFEDHAASPYMERVLRWRLGRASKGVRNRDGTGCLQSVGRGPTPCSEPSSGRSTWPPPCLWSSTRASTSWAGRWCMTSRTSMSAFS